MRLMHTKLPDFIQKVQDAGKKLRPETEVTLKGLESMESAKLASLRVGRIEEEIIEITQDPNVARRAGPGGGDGAPPDSGDHPYCCHQRRPEGRHQ